MTEEQNYEDYEDEAEESDHLVMCIGSDGVAELHKPEDYMEMKKTDFAIIKEFIDENKEAFSKFCKSKEPLDLQKNE